jgi:hypothetical protein
MPAKEYRGILDFIGHYNNNFMIPMALSDDRTDHKDNIRKYEVDGSRIIPGASTVNFDEISRKRIYESINQGKFNSVNLCLFKISCFYSVANEPIALIKNLI